MGIRSEEMELMSHYFLSLMPLCWVIFAIIFLWGRKPDPVKVKSKR